MLCVGFLGCAAAQLSWCVRHRQESPMKRCPMKRTTSPRVFWAVLRTILGAVACAPTIAFSQTADGLAGGVVVRLRHVLDRLPDRGWPGLTNIFFAPVPPALQNAVRIGERWRGVELADVVTGQGLPPSMPPGLGCPAATKCTTSSIRAVRWTSRTAGL